MFGIGKKYCREGHVMDPSWKVCPVCIAPVVGWLVWQKNGIPRQVFTLHEGRSVIGCGADCEVRLRGEGVARQHAQIVFSGSTARITKLSESAALTVNFEETASAPLIDGDLLKIGEEDFKFKCL